MDGKTGTTKWDSLKNCQSLFKCSFVPPDLQTFTLLPQPVHHLVLPFSLGGTV